MHDVIVPHLARPVASLFIRVLAPAVGTSTAPLFIAIGGTAELCFLAWLLIKAVNAPVAGTGRSLYQASARGE